MRDSPRRAKPRLDDRREILRGKNGCCIIGTTGFVGKVALSMLLHHYPEVGRVYCLVRPGSGSTADERFFRKVASSEAFDPVRDVHGAGYDAFMRAKIVALAGDIGRPLCNFTDEMCAEVQVDVILNSAGLVSFAPSARERDPDQLALARRTCSTSRASSARSSGTSRRASLAVSNAKAMWEDEPVRRLLSAIVDDRARCGTQRRASGSRLRSGGFVGDRRPPEDHRSGARALERSRAHLGVPRKGCTVAARSTPRSRRRRRPQDRRRARAQDVAQQGALTDLGVERARHWGWTNTYTYTKSLGEQIILSDRTVASTIVRPAVVESAIRYPFPGWNEGFNTTAPLMYLMLKGHPQRPGRRRRRARRRAGRLRDRRHAARDGGGRSPASTSRSISSVPATRIADHEPAAHVQLTALAVRQHHLDNADAESGIDAILGSKCVRARLESMPVSYSRFRGGNGADGQRKLPTRLIGVIDEKLPKWGAPRIEACCRAAREELQRLSTFTAAGPKSCVDLFKNHSRDRSRHRDPLRQRARVVGARHAGRSGQVAVGAASARPLARAVLAA